MRKNKNKKSWMYKQTKLVVELIFSDHKEESEKRKDGINKKNTKPFNI